jgi:hypothetical protein
MIDTVNAGRVSSSAPAAGSEFRPLYIVAVSGPALAGTLDRPCSTIGGTP